MRKSGVFLIFISALMLSMAFMFVHASGENEAAKPRLRDMAVMVKRLELTDLALFTDARYTRHPAMADLHGAFQDFPMAFDHFPSGSLISPPPHLGSNESD